MMQSELCWPAGTQSPSPSQATTHVISSFFWWQLLAITLLSPEDPVLIQLEQRFCSSVPQDAFCITLGHVPRWCWLLPAAFAHTVLWFMVQPPPARCPAPCPGT